MLDFKFPDTGEGVTEGQFLRWLVDESDEVEEDQALAEVETDKAVVDIPAPATGTIKELLADPGDTVKVGDVIMRMETGDTEEEKDTNEAEKTPETEKQVVEEFPDEPEEDSGNDGEEVTTTSHDSDVLAMPKVRKLARDRGVDLASIKKGEKITEEEVLNAAEGRVSQDITEEPESSEDSAQEATEKSRDISRVSASPSVRQLARDRGIDITNVEGTGRGGTVTREDVLRGPSKKPKSESTEETPEGRTERRELSGIRKTIGDRMTESRFTAPHVTHIDKADVTGLVELRDEVNQGHDAHITYLPFIMKAAALAMKKYPELNAELDENADEVILKHYYDFNIAVDTDRGLMVPVIKDIDGKNMVDLADDIGEKVGRTRNGDIGADEMQGGTFSITNVGVIGGEAFTPIINYPQTAILGIGKIQETAEVHNGEVVPRTTVKLSLSFDHRVIDGATAARFMNEVIKYLENPEKMVVEL